MIKKKLIRLISGACIALTLSTMPGINNTLVVNAAENYTIADEGFIPTRPYYPYFISTHSSYTSDLLKGIWERLIFEENNFGIFKNKGSYTSWSNEYYAGEDTNYINISGDSVSWAGKTFSTDTGDFDAFLGNTLEANPEMLGEMLGLSGYTALSSRTGEYSQSQILDTYRKVFYNKLANPASYNFFAHSMVKLTKDGKYLTDKALQSASYNGKAFDYWMLCTLAYFYEGDGSETYLSPTQVKWLEGYTSQLVTEYVNSGSKAFNGSKWVASGSSLAGKYAPIYNLIARSSVGVNNPAKNKEFFNYVVSTGNGAGAWLNKHNSISIPGLNDIDNLAALFALSDGWCGGLDATSTSCHSHSSTCNAITKGNCLPTSKGGKATAMDIICVQLHRNSVAEGFLKTNAEILKEYGNDSSVTEAWQYRHKVKHLGLAAGQAPSELMAVSHAVDAIAGFGQASGSRGAPYFAENLNGDGHHAEAWFHDGGIRACRCTARIYLSKIAESANAPQTVAMTFWASDDLNNSNVSEPRYWDDLDYSTTWSSSSGKITLVGGYLGHVSGIEDDYVSSGSYTPLYIGNEDPRDYYLDEERGGRDDRQRYNSKSYKFDISKLSPSELKNGYIDITICSQISGGDEEYCGVGPYLTATVENKIANCDISGHDWRVLSESDQAWSSDFSKLTVKYTCANNRTETMTKTYYSKATASSDGKTISYEVIDYKGNTFTRLKPSGIAVGELARTVDFPKNSPYYAYNRSNSTVYPAGSKSDSIYKLAKADIKVTLNKNNAIPAGTQSIKFYYSASKDLKELTINVYDGRGNIIGQGGLGKPSTIDTQNGVVTIKLINNSNEDLKNAYVHITALAHTQNWSSAKSEPSTAVADIYLSKMVLYF